MKPVFRDKSEFANLGARLHIYKTKAVELKNEASKEDINNLESVILKKKLLFEIENTQY